MYYIKRENLTVICVNDNAESISLDMLAPIILDRPSNIIYCECRGKLYGMISMGDIARNRNFGKIPINMNFSCVSADEYMEVRNLFYNNKNINGVPVVNSERILGGGYIRWDDFIIMRYMLGSETLCMHQGTRLALVRPSIFLEEKQKMFQRLHRYLRAQGADIICIDNTEILEYADVVDRIYFVDEDELRGIDTYYTYILNKNCRREKFITYQRGIKQDRYGVLGQFLKELSEKEVHVLNLVYHSSAVWQQMMKKISDKFETAGEKMAGKISMEMYPDFFDDLYEREYAESIMQIAYAVESKSGTGKLKDCCSPYYNVTDGERYTEGQPLFSQKNIYFFGPCFIYGHYVEDRYTIESFLQRKLNGLQSSVKVINYGSQYSDQIDLEIARIMSTVLRRGDVIVLYADNEEFAGIKSIDLACIMEKSDVKAEWVIDDIRHCNHKINALYADAIYDTLELVLSESVDRRGELIEENDDFVKKLYIDRYFSDFVSSNYDKIGAIVMNCNPFTRGHRYLIEQALEKVDFLIVFVVEEDKSVFSFAERFAMVCEGVADLENVKVVPSGPFILSKTSFPEYFIKEKDEDIVENVENDITFFAERIAPHLNISYRFVGEEPSDIVTREYNQAMKRILPVNGIELIEIPRKEQNNRCISASLVRKCLEDGDGAGLQELVPMSTMEILSLISECFYSILFG